jgi:hypothetical protein
VYLFEDRRTLSLFGRMRVPPFLLGGNYPADGGLRRRRWIATPIDAQHLFHLGGGQRIKSLFESVTPLSFCNLFEGSIYMLLALVRLNHPESFEESLIGGISHRPSPFGEFADSQPIPRMNVAWC